MAYAKQVLAMVRNHAEGENEQFLTIALQVAAAAARKGHRTVAEDIRAAVKKAQNEKPNGLSATIPFTHPLGNLTGLLEQRHTTRRLNDLILSKKLRTEIKILVREQSQRDCLRGYGKTPASNVLFVGPPGTGKTVTATALASELKIPLFVIRLESLISRYMGETAAKLRLIFDEIAKRRAVYLFDEFDAVGAFRGAKNDIAEMRRVLNSFLQFIEFPNFTDSLVIGTTNYSSMLDSALLRRFDQVLFFGPPTDEEIELLVKWNLSSIVLQETKWEKIISAARGLSQAEIVRATETAVKTAILDERSFVTAEEVANAMEFRHDMQKILKKEHHGL